MTADAVGANAAGVCTPVVSSRWTHFGAWSTVPDYEHWRHVRMTGGGHVLLLGRADEVSEWAQGPKSCSP
jgi:hypothetical protein